MKLDQAGLLKSIKAHDGPENLWYTCEGGEHCHGRKTFATCTDQCHPFMWTCVQTPKGRKQKTKCYGPDACSPADQCRKISRHVEPVPDSGLSPDERSYRSTEARRRGRMCGQRCWRNPSPVDRQTLLKRHMKSLRPPPPPRPRRCTTWLCRRSRFPCATPRLRRDPSN